MKSPLLRPLLADPHEPFVHRDLSWLQFNERVLAEAADPANPWLERLKFLAITASNLDEFFTIRVPALKREIHGRAGGSSDAIRLERLRKTWAALVKQIAGFQGRQEKTLVQIAAGLEPLGPRLVTRLAAAPLDARERAWAGFERELLPRLPAPEVFSPRRLLALGSLEWCALLANGTWVRLGKDREFRPVFSPPGDPSRGFFADQALALFAERAFRVPGPVTLLRLTRDGDFAADLDVDDPASIPDVIRRGVSGRDRGRPTRLQICRPGGGTLPEAELNRLQSVLKLERAQVFATSLTHGWTGLRAWAAEAPGTDARLRYAPRRARVPLPLRKVPGVLESVRRQDRLLHHPYDSFDAVVNFVREAAEDPAVTQIEMTLYRVDPGSPLIAALKGAARRKRVRVLVELRARFDEANNLRASQELKDAGAEVHFAVGRLKLHAKLILVTRREAGPDGGEVEARYTHLGTGNYHAVTAEQYTDLSVITARPEVGADARAFFDAFLANRAPTGLKRLIPAPTGLHRKMRSLVEGETQAARAGKPARIVAKLNSFVDRDLVKSFYEASQAGVKIDLIIRGACSLIPGVKGLSENIRVVSVVDRFLEHSRIYSFGAADELYLSSADWMPRNFFSRLELAFPVLEPRLRSFIRDVVLPTYLADTVKARVLGPDGQWTQRAPVPGTELPVRSQFFLQTLAENDYAGTPLGGRR